MFTKTHEQAIGNKIVRTYKNSLTGTELTTSSVYKDKSGHVWHVFDDLFSLPFIRHMAAKRVLDLYGNGLALIDVKSISEQLKAILKSNHVEKYERAYAKIMELENLAETMADPVKQCIGLCTVYTLLDDERPDTYLQPDVNLKLSLLNLDIDAQTFFLTWWTGVMNHSGQILKGLSQIVSTVGQ
jgi:hypothetical protein